MLQAASSQVSINYNKQTSYGAAKYVKKLKSPRKPRQPLKYQGLAGFLYYFLQKTGYHSARNKGKSEIDIFTSAALSFNPTEHYFRRI
jgi:hypothetical protein